RAAYSRGYPGPSMPLSWTGQPIELWESLVIRQDGRLDRNPFDLYELFISALVGAHLGRVRRCPVCEKYFYRIRADKQGKGGGCSEPCNRTLRQRRFRRNKRVEGTAHRRIGGH